MGLGRWDHAWQSSAVEAYARELKKGGEREIRHGEGEGGGKGEWFDPQTKNEKFFNQKFRTLIGSEANAGAGDRLRGSWSCEIKLNFLTQILAPQSPLARSTIKL